MAHLDNIAHRFVVVSEKKQVLDIYMVGVGGGKGDHWLKGNNCLGFKL